MANGFVFNVADRVRLTTPDPIMHGKLGIIVSRHRAGDVIPRLRDNLYLVPHTPDLIYMVQLDGTNPAIDDPVYMEEDWLELATDQ